MVKAGLLQGKAMNKTDMYFKEIEYNLKVCIFNLLITFSLLATKDIKWAWYFIVSLWIAGLLYWIVCVVRNRAGK